MEIIDYNSFYDLKLSDFVPDKTDIVALKKWEFMNAIWYGESVGFSTWLKRKGKTKERSISLDLNDLPTMSIDKIFSALKLNVRKGMTRDEAAEFLGPPKNTQSFVPGRASFEYIVGSTEKYYLSLTITDTEGLIYIVLMNHANSVKALEKKHKAKTTV